MHAPKALDTWQWGPALRKATESVDGITTAEAFRVVGSPRRTRAAEIRMGRELRALGFTQKRRTRASSGSGSGGHAEWVYCRPAVVGDAVAGPTPARAARQEADRARCLAMLRGRLEALERLAGDLVVRLQRARPLEVETRAELYREGRSYAAMYRAIEAAIAAVQARTLEPGEAVSSLVKHARALGPEAHCDASSLPIEWARVSAFPVQG